MSILEDHRISYPLRLQIVTTFWGCKFIPCLIFNTLITIELKFIAMWPEVEVKIGVTEIKLDWTETYKSFYSSGEPGPKHTKPASQCSCHGGCRLERACSLTGKTNSHPPQCSVFQLLQWATVCCLTCKIIVYYMIHWLDQIPSVSAAISKTSWTPHRIIEN